MAYDDFRPSSKANISQGGINATRTIRLYAADEGAALAHASAPKYGDQVTVGDVLLYCNQVSAEQVETGVNSAGLFLFDVTATFQTLDKSPQEGKARWSASGQNEQV